MSHWSRSRLRDETLETPPLLHDNVSEYFTSQCLTMSQCVVTNWTCFCVAVRVFPFPFVFLMLLTEKQRFELESIEAWENPNSNLGMGTLPNIVKDITQVGKIGQTYGSSQTNRLYTTRA